MEERTVTNAQCQQAQKIIILTMQEEMNKMKAEIIDVINSLPDKFDARYASKLTEKVVYAMMGTILGSVLLAFIFLVLDKKI